MEVEGGKEEEEEKEKKKKIKVWKLWSKDVQYYQLSKGGGGGGGGIFFPSIQLLCVIPHLH